MNDVRKLCTFLRKSAVRNNENGRVLIHYNGHGVPRPTANGEIWVFNSVSKANLTLLLVKYVQHACYEVCNKVLCVAGLVCFVAVVAVVLRAVCLLFDGAVCLLG